MGSHLGFKLGNLGSFLVVSMGISMRLIVEFVTRSMVQVGANVLA